MHTQSWLGHEHSTIALLILCPNPKPVKCEERTWWLREGNKTTLSRPELERGQSKYLLPHYLVMCIVHLCGYFKTSCLRLPTYWLLNISIYENLKDLITTQAAATTHLPRVSDSLGLGWSLRIHISHEFPCIAADLGTTLWEFPVSSILQLDLNLSRVETLTHPPRSFLLTSPVP